MKEDYLPVEGAGREELKMFYAWSIEDAIRAQGEWEKTDRQAVAAGDSEWTAQVGLGEEENPSVAKGPLFRWDDAQWLKTLGDHFMATGDKDAILKALAVCALNDLPIPRWCSIAYLKAYRNVRQYRAKSWDDAFGQPHPKNAKIENRRDKREKEFLVYDRVREIKRESPNTPIDRNLFEDVGKEFCISGGLADQYYCGVVARLKKR